ncbi:MAG: hypothetical protein JXB32_21410 [Deltaproteobacteria bacterium]|nr:hypothetical protein [Deltaproteobacteria bacterium]
MAAGQEAASATADPVTGEVELPDPGPPPAYPWSRLQRPLSLTQWEAELVVDGVLGLDVGFETEPTDVVFGTALGILDRLQAELLLDLRAVRAPGAAEPDVAYALEAGGTYAFFSGGAGDLAAAGSLSVWIPLESWGGPPVRIEPTIFGVWRIARWFGIWGALAMPFSIADDSVENAPPVEVLTMLTVRPHFQPFDWLWFAAEAGIGLRGGDDLVVPLELTLGLTPWFPFDLAATFSFPDLKLDEPAEPGVPAVEGPEHRRLTVGLRVRLP